LNFGAGAELGIYKNMVINGDSSQHWIVDKNLSMPMTLKLSHKNGQTIFYYTPAAKQWWITGFNPYWQDVRPNNMTAVYTIDFSTREQDKKMYWAFKKVWVKSAKWTFNDQKFTAQCTF
jgi:hypothetical protein